LSTVPITQNHAVPSVFGLVGQNKKPNSENRKMKSTHFYWFCCSYASYSCFHQRFV